MALIVEDGTGVAGANGYIDVAYADAYHGARGEAAWGGPNDAKEHAIIRATDYIETRWGANFLGTPEHLDPRQPLSFPRLGLRDRVGQTVLGIPENLRRATAEYAVRAMASALMPDPVTDPSGAMVTSKREKVGPIETSMSFSVLQGFRLLKAYPAADRLLTEYLSGGGRGRVYR